MGEAEDWPAQTWGSKMKTGNTCLYSATAATTPGWSSTRKSCLNHKIATSFSFSTTAPLAPTACIDCLPCLPSNATPEFQPTQLTHIFCCCEIFPDKIVLLRGEPCAVGIECSLGLPCLNELLPPAACNAAPQSSDSCEAMVATMAAEWGRLTHSCMQLARLFPHDLEIHHLTEPQPLCKFKHSVDRNSGVSQFSYNSQLQFQPPPHTTPYTQKFTGLGRKFTWWVMPEQCRCNTKPQFTRQRMNFQLGRLTPACSWLGLSRAAIYRPTQPQHSEFPTLIWGMPVLPNPHNSTTRLDVAPIPNFSLTTPDT